MKQYHLGDILSITTGKLVSLRHMEGVYDILDYMTGDGLFTQQLPRATRECAPELIRQHPELGEVDASGCNENTWRTWLDEQIKRYGMALSVEPMDGAKHARLNPLQELVDMVGEEKVIAVQVGDAS